MKNALIIAIFSISIIYMLQASEKFVKVEKWTEYTYEQGLSISLDISTCLMSDEGVKRFTEKSLDKFEQETGSRDFVIMALVMEISLEYKIGMEEKYISEEYRKYVKSVVSNCKRVAEFDHIKK